MLRIPDVVRRLCRVTPLVFAPPLGCLLKLESLQRTGSFKLRGAALRLARLPLLDRAAGVIAASAGNHGLGLACAAQAMNIPVRVIVPEDAPRIKREGISSFGAEVVRYGASYDEAEQLARQMAQEEEAIFVSPFDDTDVIEGNGAWLAQEILQQRPGITQVVIPIGGGGLAAGMTAELVAEGVRVVGVQPRANCAMAESLRAGRALVDYRGGRTLCEGLAGSVSHRTFRAVRQHIDRIELVEEDQIRDAVVFAFRKLGLVVEASAAVVIAAVRSGQVTVDERTVLLISGGNVDADLLDSWLAGEAGGL
ncbi:MAG: pyridoxal-phosphate dependent enzyme [Myxococcales bacterium]|nr:pyridoxal-phosphate dependent enzyme [Myxococcota bacterium]MDW8280507.1 pyridoxal-phosphate dependent enzyme [Myxococcales bacterium]